MGGQCVWEKQEEDGMRLVKGVGDEVGFINFELN